MRPLVLRGLAKLGLSKLRLTGKVLRVHRALRVYLGLHLRRLRLHQLTDLAGRHFHSDELAINNRRNGALVAFLPALRVSPRLVALALEFSACPELRNFRCIKNRFPPQ
jgi:hypothetical protein